MAPPDVRVLVEGQEERAQALLCAGEGGGIPRRHSPPDAANGVEHKEMGIDHVEICKHFLQLLNTLGGQCDVS